jgi:hypothetical protein
LSTCLIDFSLKQNFNDVSKPTADGGRQLDGRRRMQAAEPKAPEG